jgi:hypothetical protein
MHKDTKVIGFGGIVRKGRHGDNCEGVWLVLGSERAAQ